MKHKGFLVLDFGSQLTQLIARRLRELGFYSEIHPYDYPLDKIKQLSPYGIILSGGPASVYDESSPKRNVKELIELAPVLGICYGMQLLAHDLGGKVNRSTHREYGLNYVEWSDILSKEVPKKQKVWMSHGDVVERAPQGCSVVAVSESNHPAALKAENYWALQFHPEVSHTEHGLDILNSFARDLCKAKADWTAPHVIQELSEQTQALVGGSDHILCGLSGGVDSTVVATLLTKIFGKERVHCVFVDNGLLRKGEYTSVLRTYQDKGLNVRGIDARNKFLQQLKGVTDPEQKRKIIGRVFVEVFEESIDRSLPIRWLAQGTLYPDVIESVSSKGGPSQTIKSHHNVGGLPEKMNLKLLEPLRELFKDEVRILGRELGLEHEMLWRHPFPGPGLAIRIMGEVNEENLSVLREADDVFISHLKKEKLYDFIWQAFCVLLPVQTVGVQGDGRTYEKVLALRAVTSKDGMTADWYPFTQHFLQSVSNDITNKVRGINRVVYDVTSKPPATIEWE